jgi:hypothetical protein
MANNLTELTGTVGEAVKVGTIVKGQVIGIAAGVALDFMTVEQCAARKTSEDTRYLNIEVAMGEYGTKNKSFPDYSNPDDPAQPINPNSIHGRVMATYPELGIESEVNMIAIGKNTPNGVLIVWDMVLA